MKSVRLFSDSWLSIRRQVEEYLRLNPVYDPLHLTRRTVKFLRKLFDSDTIYQATLRYLSVALAVQVLLYDDTHLAVKVVNHFFLTRPVPLHVGHVL